MRARTGGDHHGGVVGLDDQRAGAYRGAKRGACDHRGVDQRVAAREADLAPACAAVRVEEAAVPGGASRRQVSFARGAALVDTPVIARAALGPGFRAGPLIVESYDTTVVVPPGTRARADATGNLILEID